MLQPPGGPGSVKMDPASTFPLTDSGKEPNKNRALNDLVAFACPEMPFMLLWRFTKAELSLLLGRVRQPLEDSRCEEE